MMDKKKRFILFAIGIGFGCLFSYFVLFRGKDRFDWLPENRVKNKIAETKLDFTQQAKCLMECYSVSEEEIKSTLKNGEVNFSESKTQEKPCPVYIIEDASSKITCISCDSSTQIIHVVRIKESKSCTCN